MSTLTPMTTTTTTCPDTEDGMHRLDTFTIPARSHFGDIETVETPSHTVQQCWVCGETV